MGSRILRIAFIVFALLFVAIIAVIITSMKVFVVAKSSNTQSTDSAYINASAQFQSYLCENNNGVVSGILFVQEGATY